MNTLQPIEELEKWWEDPDPWDYENNPDDLNRRSMLLSVIPQRKYKKTLDIGCGNGFITTHLPGDIVIGIDVSKNAIQHAKTRSRNLKHIEYFQISFFDLAHQNWDNVFDLIVITGVLYPQYIGHSNKLSYIIIDGLLESGGTLISCHIDEWYSCRFPFITLGREYYPYREYTHILEVYQK